MLRGDVYDGRTFVKSSMSGPPSDPKNKGKQADIDLEIKVGVVAGHYGEALRGLDLRMSRRNGRIRSFSLNAKIGRDTALIGDMRTRTSSGRPVMYFETSDAGALFRFTDVYPRIVGGKIWVVMDPPTPGQRAAGRTDQPARLLDPRRERAGKRGGQRAAGRAPKRRVHPGARRIHPHARPHHDPRRRGEGADDRRHHGRA